MIENLAFKLELAGINFDSKLIPIGKNGYLSIRVPNNENPKLSFIYQEGVSMGYPYGLEVYNFETGDAYPVTLEDAVELCANA